MKVNPFALLGDPHLVRSPFFSVAIEHIINAFHWMASLMLI